MENKPGAEKVLDQGCVDTPGGLFGWTLTRDGSLTIRGSGVLARKVRYHVNSGEGWDSHYDSEEESWPWEQYAAQIRRLVFEEGVQGLESSVLGQSSAVEELVLPETLKRIGSHAFCRTAVRELVLPEGLTSIGTRAFSETNIRELVLPETLKSIDSYAFSNTPLSRVRFPEGLTSIGDEAFSDTAIRKLRIPDSLTEIGEGAFDRTDLPFDGDALYADGWLLKYTGRDKAQYHVRPGTRGIAKNVFRKFYGLPLSTDFGKNRLEDLFIPGSVKHIGSQSGSGIRRVYLGMGCPYVPGGFFGDLGFCTIGSSVRIDKWAKPVQILRRKDAVPTEQGAEPWSFSVFPNTEKTYDRAMAHPQKARLTKALDLLKETALEEAAGCYSQGKLLPLWRKEHDISALSAKGLLRMEPDEKRAVLNVEIRSGTVAFCSVCLAILDRLEQMRGRPLRWVRPLTLELRMPEELTRREGYEALRELLSSLFPRIAGIRVLASE